MGEVSGRAESKGDDSANVLLKTTHDSGRSARACADLFRSESDVTRGLVVTFGHSIDDWLATHEAIEELAEELVIVSVGDSVRSTAVAHSQSTTAPAPERMLGEPVIDFVSNPVDLSELGSKINAYLTNAMDLPMAEHARTVLCLDSISALLDASDVRTVFRFLHILTALVRERGATAHYHLDSSQLDPETVSILSVLFDCELEH